MDFCDQITSEDKPKMSEFYLHNMALTKMNAWDPKAKLGDLQLMAMLSWINHEELRATEIKRFMIKEQNEPLMLRVDPSYPMALISTTCFPMTLRLPLNISPIRHKTLHILKICKGYLGMILCMHP